MQVCSIRQPVCTSHGIHHTVLLAWIDTEQPLRIECRTARLSGFLWSEYENVT